MSVYKVIQDIEAEDHILGPLSLRQFIFGLIAVLCFYFVYLVASKGVGFLSILFLPPGLFALFFAIPFGRDQPTEIWALAKIRFLIKPRVRKWNQSGVKELVTVTAPKKIETVLTDGLSQNEVHSRLSALANTLDSRGWAVKNVNVNLYTQPLRDTAPQNTDRLVQIGNVPQQVPDYSIQASDDMLDMQNNPIAQQFTHLIDTSVQTHHQQLQDMMNGPAIAPPATMITPPVSPQSATNTPAPQPDYWFMNNPVMPPKLAPDQAMFAPQVVLTGSAPQQVPSLAATAAEPTPEELALARQIKQEHEHTTTTETFGRMKTVQPLDYQQSVPQISAPSVPLPPKVNPAVSTYVNNDDLSIDVIAREAKRANEPERKLDDGEVVISLH